MADQKFIEIEPSPLFLTHFYGPGGLAAPADFEIAAIRIPLSVEVPGHTGADGSAYAGQCDVAGDPGFIFDLADGVDTFRMVMQRKNMGLPGLILTGI